MCLREALDGGLVLVGNCPALALRLRRRTSQVTLAYIASRSHSEVPGISRVDLFSGGLLGEADLCTICVRCMPYGQCRGGDQRLTMNDLVGMLNIFVQERTAIVVFGNLTRGSGMWL